MELLDFLRKYGLEALQQPPYSIEVGRHNMHPNLVQLNYNLVESEKNDITATCRGIILDEANNWNVVAYPFNRFANYGESWAQPIDWKTARVYNKCDGSLIIVYFYAGEWHAATRGMAAGHGRVDAAPFTFADLFWKTYLINYTKADLNPDFTYMFELTTPFNMIVVRHVNNSITLLGVRDNKTFREFDLARFSFGDENKMKTPEVFEASSLDACAEMCAKLDPIKQEGFVVVDGNFNRVKIKSPSYVLWSHVRFNFTPKRMLELFIKGEHEEYISYFPEHRHMLDHIVGKFDEWEKSIQDFYDTITSQAKTQKEFATLALKSPWYFVLFGVRNGTYSSVRNGMLTFGHYMENRLNFLKKYMLVDIDYDNYGSTV